MLSNSYLKRPQARKQGVSMVLFVLSLPVMFGMIGLVVDLTNLYTKRAYAQRAADAAALAGSMVSAPDPNDSTKSNDPVIVAEAIKYAGLNGYTAGQVQVDPHVGNQLGKVQVTVSRSESIFFIPVLEVLLGNNPVKARTVGASATAEKISDVSLPLGGDYGTTTGAANPSAFGPSAKHSYGDPYSVLYHDDGTPNTPENFNKNKGSGFDNTSHYQPDGFFYNMNVSPNYVADPKHKFLRVELYDPDGYDPKDGESLDEIHTDYLGPKPKNFETTTRYTIYKVADNGTLQKLASTEYGNDSSVDAATLKAQGKNPWITPDGFKLDLATVGAGKFKIQVQTTDGSSENGYNLRAGPDYGDEYPEPPVKTRTVGEWAQLESDWNKNNGDQGGLNPYNTKVPIEAENRLQMNFTRTAKNVKVRLGAVPANAAGREITITKFDTDVGSTDIRYSFVQKGSSTPIPATGKDFLVPTNDVWSQNKVTVPDGFTGGYIYAEYDAGQNDTSSWSMKIPGVSSGSVKLVK